MKHVFALAATAALLIGCGGGGGGGDPSPAVPAVVTIVGKITFDYVPVAVVSSSSKLDYANSVRLPARSIAVVLINSATGAELSTAKTSAAGDYSLVGPIGKSVFVRAYAKLLPVNASTTEAVSVLDNTNADAQWATDGAAFSPVDGTGLTKNLNASSG